MESNFCPLMTAAVIIKGEDTPKGWQECMEEGCAWWVKDTVMTDHSRCAIAKIAKELMIQTAQI